MHLWLHFFVLNMMQERQHEVKSVEQYDQKVQRRTGSFRFSEAAMDRYHFYQTVIPTDQPPGCPPPDTNWPPFQKYLMHEHEGKVATCKPSEGRAGSLLEKPASHAETFL